MLGQEGDEQVAVEVEASGDYDIVAAVEEAVETSAEDSEASINE